MELHEFEQAVLKLAFETESRITTAAVAYYLGIPSREANKMLNALLEEGTLELDSDENGNLFYRVPQQSPSDKVITSLKHELAPSRPEVPQRLNLRMTSSLDDDSGVSHAPILPARPVQPSQSPSSGIPSSMLKRQSAPQPMQDQRERDQWGGFDDYYGSNSAQVASSDGMAGRRKIAASAVPAWTAVSTRSSATDGTVGKTFASKYVVASDARCEPQPLASQRPIMASCADPVDAAPVARQQHSEQWYAPSSTAMVHAGSTAISTEVEQPEHQPGMALLLSLILCGTGQMYNGEVSKGIMMMVLCFLLWFMLLGWVVHIWSIVDAVVVAERLNRQQR